MAALDEEQLVVYEPQGEVTHTITVWTNVDCRYCRRFHRRIERLGGKGVRVRYAAWPWPSTEGNAERMRAVWCAPDRTQAMDLAKRRKEVPPAQCEETMAQQRALGREMGIKGVPAFVSESGRLLKGYRQNKFGGWLWTVEREKRKMDAARRRAEEGTQARPLQPIGASAGDGR